MEVKKVTYEIFKTLITESNAITTVKFVEKPTPSSGKKPTPLPEPFTKTPTFDTLEDNEKKYQELLAGHTIENGELVKPAEPVTTTTSAEPVKTLDDNNKLTTTSVSPTKSLDDTLGSNNTTTGVTTPPPTTTEVAAAAAGGNKKSRKKTSTKNKKRRKTRKRRKTKKRRNNILK